MAADSKTNLRRRIRGLLKTQTPGCRAERSAVIAEKFFTSKAFKNASQIAFYASLPEEVDTRSMMDEALRLGKHVSVPRCDLKSGRLDFYEITSRCELKKGVLNILDRKSVV